MAPLLKNLSPGLPEGSSSKKPLLGGGFAGGSRPDSRCKFLRANRRWSSEISTCVVSIISSGAILESHSTGALRYSTSRATNAEPIVCRLLRLEGIVQDPRRQIRRRFFITTGCRGSLAVSSCVRTTTMDDEIEQTAYEPAIEPFPFLLSSALLQRYVLQLKTRKYLPCIFLKSGD